MKSTIRVDFTQNNFETRELLPVIKVVVDKTSDDTRDGLLKEFFNQLRYTSKWLVVYFGHQSETKDEIIIHAIHPKDLPHQSNEMIQAIKNGEAPANIVNS